MSTLTEADDDDDDEAVKELAAYTVALLPVPTVTQTVYFVPTVGPDDGQVNEAEYELPDIGVPVPILVGAGDLQLASVLYPKETTVPFVAVMLEPVTVIDWLTGPVVGLLVNEVDGAEAWKGLPTSVLPIPLTWAHTIYVPAAVDGQVNLSMKPPFDTCSLVALPTGVNELQSVPRWYPKVTDTVPLAGVMPVPITVICVPAEPDLGLLEIEGDAACAGKAAPQQSAVSAKANTAEHRISAMLVETIFDRFSPAFMLPSPKDRADKANKIVSPI